MKKLKNVCFFFYDNELIFIKIKKIKNVTFVFFFELIKFIKMGNNVS